MVELFGLVGGAGRIFVASLCALSVGVVGATAQEPAELVADPIAELILEDEANAATEIIEPDAIDIEASEGQVEQAEAVEADALPAIGENEAAPPMWKVTDGDSEIWLLGTFHILPATVNWRSDALAIALDEADTIYFEVDADSSDAQQKTVQILMTQGFNSPGVTLTDMLDEIDAESLRVISGELGVPLAALDPMRPWQAFLTLSVRFIMQQGFDPGSGVDSVLAAEARARGRDIRFFETLEEQLGFFTELSPVIEKSLLELTLREWGTQKEQFDALFDAWRLGDPDAIDALMNEAMRELAPEVYDVLIVDRNKKWVDTLSGIMESDGKTFVAVGAAHLAGKDSVPAMLAAKGYAVERYGVGG